MWRRRWPSGWTGPTTATACCDCCSSAAHPDLPATQQIALALRIVSGLGARQIARAFLVSEAAMEQRITRAKRLVGKAGTPFETPGPVERAERLGAVAAMIDLVFNEGYSAGVDGVQARGGLCGEAIRLARLLLRLFTTEPEIMCLTALMLLQRARGGPVRRGGRGGPAGGSGPKPLQWQNLPPKAWLWLTRRCVTAGRVSTSCRPPSPPCTPAPHGRRKRTGQIDRLYAAMERLAPSPVVTLNR